MDGKSMTKRIAAAALLMLCAMPLSGCTGFVQERAMEDTSQIAIQAPAAPEQDGYDEVSARVPLWFLDESGTKLRAVTREITAQGVDALPQAALDALLNGPIEGETGVSWPDIGEGRPSRLLEISAGVATVDLPARVRELPQEMLYAVRRAVAGTLTEFSQISYVNVLIGGREEGLDLGGTLPAGALTGVDETDVITQYERMTDQMQSGQDIALATVLYFPSADGKLLLPQVRTIRYARVTPIDCLYTLLEELGSGAGSAMAAAEIPSPMDYITEMPEITRTEDGAYRAVDIQFSAEIDEALIGAGLSRGIYIAMLTDTLMGFVPGVEGVQVRIGEEIVTGLDAEQTPNGMPIEFERTIATRADFADYAGAPVVLYQLDEVSGGLVAAVEAMRQNQQHSPRAQLTRLMAMTAQTGAACLPPGLTDEDILAVHVGRDMIAVNLSQRFANALSSLSARRERAAVYAMVNMLTEGEGAQKVAFYFGGKQVQTLAGGLEMRGAFMRNPGLVVKADGSSEIL